MNRRVKLLLGQRQAEALLDAAMYGLADLEDCASNGDIPWSEHRKADESVRILARAIHKARQEAAS